MSLSVLSEDIDAQEHIEKIQLRQINELIPNVQSLF